MRIKIVPIEDKHHAFIIANWLRQYKFGAHQPLARSEVYYKEHQELIKNHLKGFMAINSEDQDQFLGFACGDSSVVHFVFIKEIFRGMGLGSQLYKALGNPKTYTHSTKQVKDKLRGMEFNPYLFTKGLALCRE